MTRRKRIDWPAVAAALAERYPPASLHPSALAWAAEAPRTQRWAVALSGGADSVTLLLLLWTHWPERRTRLRALHFDHRQRGAAASRADERFCRTLCAALGMELVVERWTEAPAQASEAEAREARMAFFRRHGRVLWLGHQADDVAENLLMRLARGSGTAGLAAPRPVQRFADERVHLRPMLTLSKAGIVAALKQAGGGWREDATNAGDRFLRNRLRREVVPRWMATGDGRDVLAGAVRSRDLLDEDDAALDAWLEAVAPFTLRGEVNLRRLAGKPRGLVRRALQRWLLRLRAEGRIEGKGPSRQTIEALLADVMTGRRTRHSLGAAGFASVGPTRLAFAADPARKDTD